MKRYMKLIAQFTLVMFSLAIHPVKEIQNEKIV
jgi:hypothetical protein